ncbi:MAG: hypothetical protein LBV26_02995 [Bacteroidales bacterium]|jgi:hypothetical protein|nr:hypothetical protein [Bacteroidales bacterium]
MNTDYVPRSDAEFRDWGYLVVGYSNVNHERWQVGAIAADMQKRIDDFSAKVEKCKLPTRNKVDTFTKNELRKGIEKDLRNYIQGMVMRNINVTNEDRKNMSLPIRDSRPTPIGDPEGQAIADVSYPGRTQLMLRIKHVDGTPSNIRSNYGHRIHYGLYEQGQPSPVSGKELRESMFTKKKRELLTFNQEDTGKTVFFCIRYENGRGVPGPWGPMFSAVIP